MPAATSQTLSGALSELEQLFDLDQAQLQKILDRFRERMNYGLAHDGANMGMIPSFVTGVPDGSEKGTYLALDLGGTNLRVCEVKLEGGSKVSMKQEKYRVSDALKTGPASDLFDYIARSVDTFLTDFGSPVEEEELLMGFTFSFPVEQTAIDKGTLLKWTKGFSCPDAPGKDVVALLQASLDKKHIKVRVNCLVNDTVGALLARGYQGGGALLGGIFGTGTNGAYVEDIDKVKKLDCSVFKQTKPKTMIINTEWGGFDDEREILPITTFDNFVARTSIVPRLHAYEKMISGMYLGEISRAVILHLIDSLLIFSGYSSTKLNEQYAFDTAYMSAIMADEAPASAEDSATRKLLVETLGLDPEHVKEADIDAVRKVCHIVGRRAARLSAIAVAAVLFETGHAGEGFKKGGPAAEIGVDGSVIEHLPGFTDALKEALGELVGPDAASAARFDFAKDGSGVGAALCALQAKKQAEAGH